MRGSNSAVTAAGDRCAHLTGFVAGHRRGGATGHCISEKSDFGWQGFRWPIPSWVPRFFFVRLVIAVVRSWKNWNLRCTGQGGLVYNYQADGKLFTACGLALPTSKASANEDGDWYDQSFQIPMAQPWMCWLLAIDAVAVAGRSWTITTAIASYGRLNLIIKLNSVWVLGQLWRVQTAQLRLEQVYLRRSVPFLAPGHFEKCSKVINALPSLAHRVPVNFSVTTVEPAREPTAGSIYFKKIKTAASCHPVAPTEPLVAQSLNIAGMSEALAYPCFAGFAASPIRATFHAHWMEQLRIPAWVVEADTEVQLSVDGSGWLRSLVLVIRKFYYWMANICPWCWSGVAPLAVLTLAAQTTIWWSIASELWELFSTQVCTYSTVGWSECVNLALDWTKLRNPPVSRGGSSWEWVLLSCPAG